LRGQIGCVLTVVEWNAETADALDHHDVRLPRERVVCALDGGELDADAGLRKPRAEKACSKAQAASVFPTPVSVPVMKKP